MLPKGSKVRVKAGNAFTCPTGGLLIRWIVIRIQLKMGGKIGNLKLLFFDDRPD